MLPVVLKKVHFFVTSLATPPRAPEAVRLLQPNAPQPITFLCPFILGGLLPVGIKPPTWPLTPLDHQQMLPVVLSLCWWARGVKGQVGGSIPTDNNPPNMNGRRRVMGWGALGCSNLTASGVRGGVARDVTHPLYSSILSQPLFSNCCHLTVCLFCAQILEGPTQQDPVQLPPSAPFLLGRFHLRFCSIPTRIH